WIADGNIVLVAEERAFRVHKSTLARHSEVSKDLFEVPQPPSSAVTASENLDGCPVVHLPDAAYDIEQLLLAIYDPIRVLGSAGTGTCRALLALLRMSHKYQIDSLFQEAIRRVEGHYVSRPPQAPANDSRLGLAQLCIAPSHEDGLDAFGTFRLVGRDELLPAALYDIAQLPSSDLV
ncbi:hypothetical protein BV20DRAFT_909727, partial [Pilatotrama ljubarskyi]